MESPFAKLKVVDLKEQLSAKGLSTKGLKRDLVERLEQAVNIDTASGIEEVPVVESNGGEEETVQSSEEPGEITSDIHDDSFADTTISAVEDTVSAEATTEIVNNDMSTDNYNMPTDKYDNIELDYDEPNIQANTVEDKEQVENDVEEQSTVLPQIGTKMGSSIVKVSNLVRPFSLDDIQALLGRFGFVTTFWIDKLRTVAFAEYESVEAAELCKFQLDGLQWPAGIGKQLVVEPSNVDMMNAAMNAPVVPIIDHHNTHRPSQSTPTAVSGTVLDQLFCKTKCSPHLYYLPKNKQ